jgi:hypothetical protein
MRKPNNRYVKELVYKLMAHAPRTALAFTWAEASNL